MWAWLMAAILLLGVLVLIVWESRWYLGTLTRAWRNGSESEAERQREPAGQVRR